MGNFASPPQDFFRPAYLSQTEHCGKFTGSPVIANVIVKIWFRAKTAMIAERACDGTDLVVVSRNHPSLARSQNFRREKRERRGDSERPGLVTVNRGPMRMRGVFHQRYAVIVTDGPDFVEMRRNDTAHVNQ